MVAKWRNVRIEGARILEAIVTEIEGRLRIVTLWMCRQDSELMWVEIRRVTVNCGRKVALAGTVDSVGAIPRHGRRGGDREIGGG